MAQVPLARLSKEDITWLTSHRCKEHSHTFISHYSCYLREMPRQEKVGILDIESTNLKANVGYMLSYGIKCKGSNKVYGRVLTSHEIRSYKFDKDLVMEFIRDVQHFDRLITYFGSIFDLSFIRSRAIKHKLPFPRVNEIVQTDVFFGVKFKTCLTRRSLKVACDFFGIKAKTHPLIDDLWNRAMAGEPKALKYVHDHNLEDLISTEQLFDRLHPYINITNRSI